MRHLLASSAVAGLLFLLPAGGANAQDNRNTSWGWGAAGGVLTFIAGGAVGSTLGWRLSKLASKGKRDDDTMELTLTQLNSSVKVLDEKLTKLETNSKEGIQGLNRTLESKMSLGSVMNTVSTTSLETVEQHIIKVEEMIERAIEKKENNQTVDPCTSNPDQTIEIYNNQPRSIIIDTNAIIDGRIFTLLESDLLEELGGRVIIAKCMTDELKRLEPESRANGFQNLSSFQGKDKGRIDQNNNCESKITDARLLQLTSGTDDKELFQGISDADKKLFLLTSDTNGILITADRKLVECCRNKNVRVLNLDELNKITNKPPEIKPPILKEGDEVEVELEKSNKDPNDAITRSCGPIVVVKGAVEFIGQTKRVVITGALKNGRAYFASLLPSPRAEPPAVEAKDPPQPPPAP